MKCVDFLCVEIAKCIQPTNILHLFRTIAEVHVTVGWDAFHPGRRPQPSSPKKGLVTSLRSLRFHCCRQSCLINSCMMDLRYLLKKSYGRLSV